MTIRTAPLDLAQFEGHGQQPLADRLDLALATAPTPHSINISTLIAVEARNAARERDTLLAECKCQREQIAALRLWARQVSERSDVPQGIRQAAAALAQVKE